MKLDVNQSLWPVIIEKLNEALAAGGCEIIIQKKSKKRSLDSNALYHVFCNQIAKHYGHSVKTVTNECKRDFGVSVLLSAEDDRATKLKWTLHKIGYWQMSPAQQCSVRDMFSVTSVMTTKEMSQVIQYMQDFYRDKGLMLESNR